jgi:AcrR family transcriptional regulator
MRSAGRPSTPVVTRDQLVVAAVELIDEEGYAGFSVRRLAARVGVGPATVTHHLGRRADILVAAVDHMLRQTPLLDPDMAEDWRDAVRLVATGYRETLRRHRRAATLIVDVGARSPAGLELSIRGLTTLERGGIPIERLLDVHAAVIAYVTGFAIQESVEGLAGVVHPGLEHQLERLPDSAVKKRFSELLPALVKAASAPKQRDSGADARFADGLDALLAGLADMAVGSATKATQR